MIKLKFLLLEAATGYISPTDIYNFYYLWYLFTNNSELFQTPYGKETLTYYTNEFKQICFPLFKKLVYKQIVKYVQRGRVDSDFPAGQPTENTSSKDLFLLMSKTFRSDLKRRNTRWESISEAVANLENANSPKEIFLWINQLFNATHNTETKIVDKISNYSELFRAFDTVSKHDPKYWKQYVSKDIRQLTDQDQDKIYENPE